MSALKDLNKIRQIELLYHKSSYNLCAQMFKEENCKINSFTTYLYDKSPEKNKKKIIKLLRAFKGGDLSSYISPHECLFYIFHCFIPFTYDFIQEIISIINPSGIHYIGIMLHYYETNYNACKNINCCGINGRYNILCDFYDTINFMQSLRGIWISTCIKLCQ